MEGSVDCEPDSGVHIKLSQLRALQKGSNNFSCTQILSTRQRWFGDKTVFVCAEFEFNLNTLHFGVSQRNRRASLDQGLMATWNQLLPPFPCGNLRFE